jgi:hypothetical protein
VPVRLLTAAVCALGAHALLYGTFRPGDGLHGYFGWYEPALALAAFVELLLLRPARLQMRYPIGETTRRLSVTALFVLLAQESLERSLQVGHPVFAAFTPSQLLVLLAGVAAAAFALAVALRAGHVVAALFVRSRSLRRRTLAPWSVVTVPRRRARPLAGQFALRAPPLLAG